MLQSQINYWNLQEQKRHNAATEEAQFQQSQASLMSANASRTQAEIAKELMPFEKMKAQATQTQAQASIMQADAALQNAETNRGNLDVNRMNAVTNQRNADINQQNANINQQNADTNMWNAFINQQNANTNAFNAETNRMVGESNIEKNMYDNFGTIVGAGLDYQRTQTEKEVTQQEHQKTPFTTANQVVGLLNSGTQSIRNLTDSATKVVDTITNVTGHGKNNNKQASGNGLVKTQLNIVKDVLPILRLIP